MKYQALWIQLGRDDTAFAQFAQTLENLAYQKLADDGKNKTLIHQDFVAATLAHLRNQENAKLFAMNLAELEDEKDDGKDSTKKDGRLIGGGLQGNVGEDGASESLANHSTSIQPVDMDGWIRWPEEFFVGGKDRRRDNN